MQARILIVDDDTVSCQLFAKVLTAEGYTVEWVTNGEEALSRATAHPYNVLLVDVRLPGMTGLAVTRAVHQQCPQVAVIVMTGFGSMETAVEAIRDGAFDYISKPMNLDELKQTVARAVGHEAQGPAGQGNPSRPESEPAGTIIGRSSAMVEVYKTVARVAPTKSTVLILGESGTGKELIARAIHQHSPRVIRPFVAVDCGVLTETLLESELFGHVRGAFTGAVADKKGVFEEAHGGTCFLDEIGDISVHMQAKLLRVLQEHEIRPVGGKDWRKVDVRVVAATNRDLAELVQKRTFRHDLYYRLNVISIALPPLRERREDIPVLAQHFLRRYSQENHKDVTAISDTAIHMLQAYAWPGNIRELENAIERAVTLAAHTVISPDDLPKEVREGKLARWDAELSQEEQSLFARLPSLDDVEKRYIEYVLHHTEGNMVQAAKILGIDRRSLYRVVERLKIAPFAKEEDT
ncbi:MAG: sigma-54-dependent transcriptional regulator [Candidatus Binatia bacterium]